MLIRVLDYMFYTRGSSDEFDYISNFTGDSDWSWENMYPYMLKVKHRTPSLLSYGTLNIVLGGDLAFEYTRRRESSQRLVTWHEWPCFH